MTDITARDLPAAAPSLRDRLAGWNPLPGLAAGMRAYRAYTELSARSDSDLAAMGLRREDLPAVAMREMDRLR